MRHLLLLLCTITTLSAQGQETREKYVTVEDPITGVVEKRKVTVILPEYEAPKCKDIKVMAMPIEYVQELDDIYNVLNTSISKVGANCGATDIMTSYLAWKLAKNNGVVTTIEHNSKNAALYDYGDYYDWKNLNPYIEKYADHDRYNISISTYLWKLKSAVSNTCICMVDYYYKEGDTLNAKKYLDLAMGKYFLPGHSATSLIPYSARCAYNYVLYYGYTGQTDSMLYWALYPNLYQGIEKTKEAIAIALKHKHLAKKLKQDLDTSLQHIVTEERKSSTNYYIMLYGKKQIIASSENIKEAEISNAIAYFKSISIYQFL